MRMLCTIKCAQQQHTTSQKKGGKWLPFVKRYWKRKWLSFVEKVDGYKIELAEVEAETKRLQNSIQILINLPEAVSAPEINLYSLPVT